MQHATRTTRAYAPAPWLPLGHLQTLWPVLMRRPVEVALTTERLELPDGDFLDLCRTGRREGPLVLLIHGLEGSIDSHYARGMLQAIHERGWRGVFMHFRGCSGEPNRLPRCYHSGDTADLAAVVAAVTHGEGETPIAAIGFSIGGNALLKWLGETGDANPLCAAAVASVPFELDNAARRLDRGFSRVYQRHFIRRMRASLHRKIDRVKLPFTRAELADACTFRQFDDLVTAALHGFAGVDDYYTRASCRQFLGGIRRPTLIVHSRNDPFMTPAIIPGPEELPEAVTLEVVRNGGHLGFVSGRWPWKPTYWLEQRIPDYLEGVFTGSGAASAGA